MTRSVIFFFTVSLLLLLAAVSAIASSGNVTSGFSYGVCVSGVTVGECITAEVEDEEGVEAVVRRILQQQRRKLSYKTLQKQQSCNGKIAALEQLTIETHLALTTTDANSFNITKKEYPSRSLRHEHRGDLAIHDLRRRKEIPTKHATRTIDLVLCSRPLGVSSLSFVLFTSNESGGLFHRCCALFMGGVISVEPMCYRRRTSHTEGFVQAFQSAMEHHFQRQIRSILRPDPSFFGKLIPSLTTLQPCLHLFVNLMSDVGGNPLRRLALSHLFVNLVSDVGGNPLRRPALSHQKLVRSCFLRTTSISSSVAESISLPYLFSMNGANFSDSFSSFCFSLLTGLLPCGAVCTGPKGAIETTSVFLVGENCLSTALVTISKLSDFVVKSSPTHSSIVSNSLSSSVEDLSRLAYLFVAFYVYGQRGWMIPSFCCMEED
ncbi:hypothetical protein F2Q69_00024664 [Brassica cretica]|uniref:Uncharacterized protein n=1 Tax=Brassica cretica TaxID=69181 RepID=A0A8S9QAJ6_BRACR|nr:hypothetical protein F2Q69_00024664 [Brassica cretica]